MQKCHQYWKTSNLRFKRGCQGTAQKHPVGGRRSHERTKTNSRCDRSQENFALAERCPQSQLLQEHLSVKGTQEFLETNWPLSRDRNAARGPRSERVRLDPPDER